MRSSMAPTVGGFDVSLRRIAKELPPGSTLGTSGCGRHRSKKVCCCRCWFSPSGAAARWSS
ncbi:hypothetical protein Micbo1qcDRAFT_162660 [Microdochium bolleyi]|uniref:Uncharacterized protein n=1 Tax=Microdochium bolleyi TaxID=196109 RepID=A0A136J5H8_9PEZI|nr:hypothetical protein Micbo1qcDRAFT_162660 [Microdochium bolleyi]